MMIILSTYRLVFESRSKFKMLQGVNLSLLKRFAIAISQVAGSKPLPLQNAVLYHACPEARQVLLDAGIDIRLAQDAKGYQDFIDQARALLGIRQGNNTPDLDEIDKLVEEAMQALEDVEPREFHLPDSRRNLPTAEFLKLIMEPRVSDPQCPAEQFNLFALDDLANIDVQEFIQSIKRYDLYCTDKPPRSPIAQELLDNPILFNDAVSGFFLLENKEGLLNFAVSLREARDYVADTRALRSSPPPLEGYGGRPILHLKLLSPNEKEQ